MSQFRWFHKRQRRVLLKDRRDCRSPWTTLNGGPTTRELSLPRDNSAARLLLTAPCSLLSLTRFAFRRLAAESLLLAGQIFPWASHLAAGHVSDTPVKRGSDAVGGRTRQWFHQLHCPDRNAHTVTHPLLSTLDSGRPCTTFKTAAVGPPLTPCGPPQSNAPPAGRPPKPLPGPNF
jgi:hypothetical protein